MYERNRRAGATIHPVAYSPTLEARNEFKWVNAIHHSPWTGAGISERSSMATAWERRAANKVPDSRVSKTEGTMRVQHARSTEKARSDAIDRWSHGR